MIKELRLENFTAFNKLNVEFSPKINLIIGENGTGKTHLLKAAYCIESLKSASINKPDATMSEKEKAITERFISVFKPHRGVLGALQNRNSNTKVITELLDANVDKYCLGFARQSNNIKIDEQPSGNVVVPQAPVFFPVKEMLSFLEGFLSLSMKYELSFDQTYKDMAVFLDLPKSKEVADKTKWLMNKLEDAYQGQFIFLGGGKVIFQYFADSDNNDKRKLAKAEFSANVMAEGWRKLATLTRLLEVGIVNPGKTGTLYWDEPEANLNPQMMKKLVETLLELSRNGQQIVIATHDYMLLKWFDLLVDKGKGDDVRYHSLYKDNNSNQINIESSSNILEIENNPIADTFNELTKEQVNKTMGGLGK